MAKLLVSVRSAEEAIAALDGGASIIDVKEPSHGSLGRASTATIATIISRVAGRVPVTAALGELGDRAAYQPGCFGAAGLMENSERLPVGGLKYVKWGLAKSGARWRKNLFDAAREQAVSNPSCHPVAVAYADWQRAQAPPPDAVWAFVREQAWPVFLLDTWRKDGRTLLDWLSLEEISRICQQCRQHDILVALAGSLGENQIAMLLSLEPDIFAVRGGVCRKEDRVGTVDGWRVRRLVKVLTSSHAILES